MKKFALIAALMTMTSATWAHDMWVATPIFQIPEGKAAPVSLRVGHADEEDVWNAPWERIHSFRSYGPTGVEDQQATLAVPAPAKAPNATVSLRGVGTHIVALESYHSTSTLAAVKFNAYLDTEGLDTAKKARAAAGTSDRPGVELYSRRAKMLVQVGDTPTDNILRPIGQTLEIVPIRNPYARGSDAALPVQVLFQGRPLAGAQVRVLPLGVKEGPVQKIRTDINGRANFEVPNRGDWLVMVVHARAMADHPTAQFDTIFASLTFGFGK